jgi:hypothetical protein
LLFTDNESNLRKLFGAENAGPYVKDAFDDYVVHGRVEAVNPKRVGTKVASAPRDEMASGETQVMRLRLYAQAEAPQEVFGRSFATVFKTAAAEADQFYSSVLPAGLGKEEANVARQAYAGLLWTKQFYHFVVADWLEEIRNSPRLQASRRKARNSDWPHLFNRDIISMPDKWEYPWFAAWDLAFHMIPFAQIDPHFAKDQLNLLLREWYMHSERPDPGLRMEFLRREPARCTPGPAGACTR